MLTLDSPVLSDDQRVPKTGGFPNRTYRESRSVHGGYSSFPINLHDIQFLDCLTTRPRSGLPLREKNPITFLEALYSLPDVGNFSKTLIPRDVQRTLFPANSQLPRSGLAGVHALDRVYIRGIDGRQEVLNSN